MFPSTFISHALARVIVVSVFCTSNPVFTVAVVNVAVVGVVAPTVPLIFIEAVPVRLVTVPDEGVPSAHPFTTGEPAEPTLTPSAVATQVPSPVIEPIAGVIVTLLAAVVRPLPFTVT